MMTMMMVMMMAMMVMTGGCRYMGLDQAQREELAGRDPQHGYAWAGLAQGEDSLRYRFRSFCPLRC
jgi:hypothetical protein